MTSVGGQPLPAIFYEDPGYRLEFLGGSYTLALDGTFTTHRTIRETVPGIPGREPATTISQENGAGTYMLSGFAVFLAGPELGINREGTIFGHRFTLIVSGVPVEYER